MRREATCSASLMTAFFLLESASAAVVFPTTPQPVAVNAAATTFRQVTTYAPITTGQPNANVFTTQVPADDTVSVVCMGDSITFGFGTSMPNNTYPRMLQKLLGQKYSVTTLAQGGLTLQRNARHGFSSIPYWDTPLWGAALQSDADIMIIMLGTNDAQMGGPGSIPNWADDKFTGAAAYEADYKLMIHLLLSLKSGRKVYTMTSPPVYLYSNGYTFSQKVANEILPPLVRKITAETGALGPIDIFESVGGASLKHPEWFPDGCHMNDAGYARTAATVYKALVSCEDSVTNIEKALAADFPAPVLNPVYRIVAEQSVTPKEGSDVSNAGNQNRGSSVVRKLHWVIGAAMLGILIVGALMINMLSRAQVTTKKRLAGTLLARNVDDRAESGTVSRSFEEDSDEQLDEIDSSRFLLRHPQIFQLPLCPPPPTIAYSALACELPSSVLPSVRFSGGSNGYPHPGLEANSVAIPAIPIRSDEAPTQLSPRNGGMGYTFPGAPSRLSPRGGGAGCSSPRASARMALRSSEAGYTSPGIPIRSEGHG